MQYRHWLPVEVTSMCNIDIGFQRKSPACAISTSASNGSHQHVQYRHRLPMEVTDMCNIDIGFQWKSTACAISTSASNGSHQHVQYRHRLPMKAMSILHMLVTVGFINEFNGILVIKFFLHSFDFLMSLLFCWGIAHIMVG